MSCDIHCSAEFKVIIIGKAEESLSESALTGEVFVPIVSIVYHGDGGTNLTLYRKVYLYMNYTIIFLFQRHRGTDRVELNDMSYHRWYSDYCLYSLIHLKYVIMCLRLNVWTDICHFLLIIL